MSLYDIAGEVGGLGASGMAGAAVAIVTNNHDPDGLGRLKVRYPWRGTSDESQWARITSIMAGGDRGAFFLPEVGDEVLVVFEHGDVDHPFILGSLWNGQDKPPEANGDGKNDVRMIKSRSGHELIFCDGQSKESVTIRTKAGHTILLDDSSGEEKIDIKDKTGSNEILIDSARNAISVTSAMQLNIKASVVKIKADTTMTIKAGATLTIQGAIVQFN